MLIVSLSYSDHCNIYIIVEHNILCKNLMIEIPGSITISKIRKGESVDVEFIRYKCFIPGCNKVIQFEKNKGYSNPLSHLVSCYGSREQLETNYFEALRQSESTTSSILSCFPTIAPNERMKDIYSWIKLIITKNLPVSVCEDDRYRLFGTKGRALN